MQTLLDKLKENLQVIYRRALDADQQLAQLQQQGKGKFQHIFDDNAGFNVQSKRFQPYVEELAKDILTLESLDETQIQQALPPVVKKMEQLFVTLGNLQNSLKA